MSRSWRTAPPVGWEHVRNCFPIPNELFLFDLSANALAVYVYLLYRADRRTGQCYPGMPTMAKALHLSRSTVLRCVKALEGSGLIVTEHTDIVTKHGIKRNGNLRYTIIPVQQVMREQNERKLHELERTAERACVQAKLREQNA